MALGLLYLGGPGFPLSSGLFCGIVHMRTFFLGKGDLKPIV